MATVSLARCPEYSRDAIRGRMMRSLEEIGFDPNRFRGARVAMKPNLLLPAAPDKAIVTHPVFFEAALDIVIEHGGRPIVVESPALASVEKALRRSGYGPALDRTGVGVADATGTAIVHNERGVAFKRFEIIREVCDAEFIINLPKMKTHGLTYFTGAVKNYFGLVPGLEKAQWHLRAPTAAEFTSFLLDFYGAIRDGFSPRKTLLNIMDGICALEGEGPGPGGRARFVGVMLASEDAVALDAVASAVVGLDREKIPTLAIAESRGLGVGALENITIVGESVSSCAVSGFVPNRSTVRSGAPRWPFTSSFVKNLVLERPVPDARLCTRCHQCRDICPARAISTTAKNEKTPRFDYALCIRCYCCMEICPEGAIELQKGIVKRIIMRRSAGKNTIEPMR